MIGELDIWNNITYLSLNNDWFKQSFIEDELISYEDSNGNYWCEGMGDFPYLIVRNTHNIITTNNIHLIQRNNYLNVERKVLLYYPSSWITIGIDLVPVQPMRTPTANIFYMDYTYTSPNKKKNLLEKFCSLKIISYICNIFKKIKLWQK